jgi:hypothetical protein
MSRDKEFRNMPPVAMSNAEIAIDDFEFSTECDEAIADLRKMGGWKLLSKIVTKSRKWGLLWRADFHTTDTEVDFVNRVICRRGDDGIIAIVIAFSQDIERLPVR